jgi:hypothetical protein
MFNCQLHFERKGCPAESRKMQNRFCELPAILHVINCMDAALEKTGNLGWDFGLISGLFFLIYGHSA